MKRAISSSAERFVPAVKILAISANPAFVRSQSMTADTRLNPVFFNTFNQPDGSMTVPPSQAAEQTECASNRCLAHCWLDDEQREQGQRCLVGCWQGNYQATYSIDRAGYSAIHSACAASCDHTCSSTCHAEH